MSIVGQMAGAAVRESIRAGQQQRAPGTVAVRQQNAPLTGRVTMPAARQQIDAPLMLRETLDVTARLLTKHVEFRSRSQAVAVALWLAQELAKDKDGNPLFLTRPRLLVTSQQNGSGKSTLGDLARLILQTRAGRMSKVTPYGLCKVFGTYRETAILDDAQNVFRSSVAGTDLLSIMVNGFTPGATWVSGKSDGKVEDAYGGMMVIGKDALITKRAAELADFIVRAVVVRLDRPEFYMARVDKQAWAQAARVGTVLAAVLGALSAELEAADAELAAEMVGTPVKDNSGPRTFMQVWAPLIAIAKVAEADLPPEKQKWAPAAYRAMAELSAATGDLFTAADALGALQEATAGLNGESFWDDEPPPPSLSSDPLPSCCTAGYAESIDGRMTWQQFEGTWPSLRAGQKACEDHAGQTLEWAEEDGFPGTWNATVHGPDGRQTGYAVSIVAGE